MVSSNFSFGNPFKKLYLIPINFAGQIYGRSDGPGSVTSSPPASPRMQHNRNRDDRERTGYYNTRELDDNADNERFRRHEGERNDWRDREGQEWRRDERERNERDHIPNRESIHHFPAVRGDQGRSDPHPGRSGYRNRDYPRDQGRDRDYPRDQARDRDYPRDQARDRDYPRDRERDGPHGGKSGYESRDYPGEHIWGSPRGGRPGYDSGDHHWRDRDDPRIGMNYFEGKKYYTDARKYDHGKNNNPREGTRGPSLYEKRANWIHGLL